MFPVMKILCLTFALYFSSSFAMAQTDDERSSKSHSSFFGGSINYKGYQTGIGYQYRIASHIIEVSAFKNQSVDRLFASNHFALGLSYRYALAKRASFEMGPELDFQKMWLNKVDNRYSDSKILSLGYFLQWHITPRISLINTIGTGGYVERFYYKRQEDPEFFRGVGGLIKLQCAYTF